MVRFLDFIIFGLLVSIRESLQRHFHNALLHLIWRYGFRLNGHAKISKMQPKFFDGVIVSQLTVKRRI